MKESNLYFREFKSDIEAQEWGEKHFSHIINSPLDQEPGKSILFYTGNVYKRTNLMLRRLPPYETKDFEEYRQTQNKDILHTVSCLKETLANEQTPENIIVYRYTHKKSIRELTGKKFLRKGLVYTDKAFVSTTLCQDLLTEFGKKYSCNCILKIKVPKGTNGIYARMNFPLSKLNEQEFLLQLCTTFQIEKVHYFTRPLLIECRVIKLTQGG